MTIKGDCQFHDVAVGRLEVSCWSGVGTVPKRLLMWTLYRTVDGRCEPVMHPPSDALTMMMNDVDDVDNNEGHGDIRDNRDNDDERGSDNRDDDIWNRWAQRYRGLR